jgi:hypothetical protein
MRTVLWVPLSEIDCQQFAVSHPQVVPNVLKPNSTIRLGAGTVQKSARSIV